MSQSNKCSLRSSRGTTFSTEQYHLLFNYLKNGKKPTSLELKTAHFRSQQTKSSTHTEECYQHPNLSTSFRFNTIASRLKLRDFDQEIVFKRSNKIVIPRSRFHEVIRLVHRNDGQKHLNISKTLEKLGDSYALGCRQFGICEENVRVVVKKCVECFGAGRPKRISVNTTKQTDHGIPTSNSIMPHTKKTANSSNNAKTSTMLADKSNVKPHKSVESIPVTKPIPQKLPVSFPVQIVRLPTGEIAVQHVDPNIAISALLQQLHQVPGRCIQTTNNSFPSMGGLDVPGISDMTKQMLGRSTSRPSKDNKNLDQNVNRQMPCLVKMLQNTSNRNQTLTNDNIVNSSSYAGQLIDETPSSANLLNNSLPFKTNSDSITSSVCNPWSIDVSNNVICETADHVIVNNLTGPPEPCEYFTAIENLISESDSGIGQNHIHTESDSQKTKASKQAETADNYKCTVAFTEQENMESSSTNADGVSGTQDDANGKKDLDALIAQETDYAVSPYNKMLKIIRDMRPNIPQAVGGLWSARYRLKLSISALECLLSDQKTDCKKHMD